MGAWQITDKDVRLLCRDRQTLFVLVALPLLFIFILGLSAGQLFNAKAKTNKVKIGVVNENNSPLSEKLLAEIYSFDALEITELSDRNIAREMVADGKIGVLVLIGPRYHKLVEHLNVGDIFFTKKGKLAGRLGSLDIEVQSGASLAYAAQIVEALVFAFALQTIAPDVLAADDSKVAKNLLLKAKREVNQYQEGDHPPVVQTVAVKSFGDIVYQYLVPSYTVMFVFFIVNFMAQSLITERNTGTLNRLLIAPISRSGLMLGKTVPFFLISLVQTVLLFLAGKVLFKMWWGESPWMLLPVMVSTSLAATALGLMVATTVRTESQVSAYANFLVLTMAGLSGCLMPRSWQPELMQQIGLITPHAWALIAYDQLLNREVSNLHVVWNSCGVMIGFALAFFAVAWWRFRTLE